MCIGKVPGALISPVGSMMGLFDKKKSKPAAGDPGGPTGQGTVGASPSLNPYGG